MASSAKSLEGQGQELEQGQEQGHGQAAVYKDHHEPWQISGGSWHEPAAGAKEAARVHARPRGPGREKA